MNNKLPLLPNSLLDLIGAYGFDSAVGLSQIERLRRWELLIAGIKDYAASVATQPPQDERGQGRIPFAGYDPNFCPGSNPDNPQTEEDAEPAQPVALSTLTDEQILAGVKEFADENYYAEYKDDILRCVRALLAASAQAAASCALYALTDDDLMEADAVETLVEEGWIWDGDQWQRPIEEAELIEAMADLLDSYRAESVCMAVNGWFKWSHPDETRKKIDAAISRSAQQAAPPQPVAAEVARLREALERLAEAAADSIATGVNAGHLDSAYDNARAALSGIGSDESKENSNGK